MCVFLQSDSHVHTGSFECSIFDQKDNSRLDTLKNVKVKLI